MKLSDEEIHKNVKKWVGIEKMSVNKLVQWHFSISI